MARCVVGFVPTETLYRKHKEFSMNFNKVIVFGEINLSDLLFPVSHVFIKPSVICEILSALELGK